MITLKNPGLIDLNVIKIMGVNIKDNEDSIGFFGTGLKYAISILLKNNIEFGMYRGLDSYSFYTERKEIRGKEFEVCCMAGPLDKTELGFTTELGKNWEVWQAYREIHSNCLDEEGTITHTQEGSKEAVTTFWIDLEPSEVEGVFLNTTRDCLVDKGPVHIYKGESQWIYYQGIRALRLSKPSKFTYNIKEDCKLTEDRTICYTWKVKEMIIENLSLLASSLPEVVKEILSSNSDWYEGSLDPANHGECEPSQEFIKIADNLCPDSSLYTSTQEYIKSYSHSPPTYEERRNKAWEDLRLTLTRYCDVINWENEPENLTGAPWDGQTLVLSFNAEPTED